MDFKNSKLLPHILETLSYKPNFCETYENLCEEIDYVMSSQNMAKGKDGSTLGTELKKAYDLGKNLGVLTLTDDMVRVPFDIREGPKAPEKKSKSRSLAKDKMNLTMPDHPSRTTYTLKRSLKRGGQRRRSKHGSRSRRRGSRSRRRRS